MKKLTLGFGTFVFLGAHDGIFEHEIKGIPLPRNSKVEKVVVDEENQKVVFYVSHPTFEPVPVGGEIPEAENTLFYKIANRDGTLVQNGERRGWKPLIERFRIRKLGGNPS